MKDKLIKFLEDYEAMRVHQKNHFRSRHQSHIAKANQIGRDLDRQVKLLIAELKHGEQKTLF